MSELPKIPWGKVISNFIWILGAALILADWGLHEFLATEEKVKRRDIIKRLSFLRPFWLGMTLVAAGVCASVRIAWIAAAAGCAAFVFAWMLMKAIINK